MHGAKAYSKRMRTAKKRLRRKLKQETREAAKLVLKAARRRIRTAFATHGKAKERTGGKTLSQATKVSIRARRGSVRAEVGAGGQHGKYGRVLEEGREVRRGGEMGSVHGVGSGGKREHNAQYPKKPWLGPAVNDSRSDVYKKIGKTFRAV